MHIYVWKPATKRFGLISERTIREIDTLTKLDKMFDESPTSQVVTRAKAEAYWMVTRAMKRA